MMSTHDIVEALKRMDVDSLEEINKAMNKIRIEKFRDEYKNIEEHLKNFLVDYGNLGFGLYIADSRGRSTVISPNEMQDCKYEIAAFHKEDEERCDDYYIESENRE